MTVIALGPYALPFDLYQGTGLKVLIWIKVTPIRP